MAETPAYPASPKEDPAAGSVKDKAEDDKKPLTLGEVKKDFEAAYRSKKKLIDREQEDFKFALGEQWSSTDVEKLKRLNIKPITDNRIAPNIFLLTGLERQNRTDFKAFPEGEEDGLKAEVASALFKNAIKVSDFSYKSSDQFKDGITCGESHLEMYLDYTDDMLNGKPMWRKQDGNTIFPEPGFKEYDFCDCKYIYKTTLAVSLEDLINLFPEMETKIRNAGYSRLDLGAVLGASGTHTQPRDYPQSGEGSNTDTETNRKEGFDLVERYYKNWVETFYLGDTKTGKIEQAQDEATAKEFVDSYKNKIQQNIATHQAAVDEALGQHLSTMTDPALAAQPVNVHLQMLNEGGALPPPPPPENPDRYKIFKRLVPEIWCYAFTPRIDEPLANERAWFYPKWKSYPFVPYFARFSNAPITGDESHLLIQGLVHGVKGVQEKHNKAEMLMLRHLNSSTNSGWEIEEGQLEPEELDKLQNLGSSPGVVIQRKKGTVPLTRLTAVPISQGHAQVSVESVEAIKAQLGINADLLATQQGGSDSGRAIALRQRQGLLMVQELFDNLSRTRIIAGRFLLSQIGEIYDTETAMKILGEAFLVKNFPPPMELIPNPQDPQGGPMMDPATGMPAQRPMVDQETGQPMQFDKAMAETLLAEVLSGQLGKYDVTVGESVASETQKIANAQEVKDMAASFPGMIPLDILVEESQLPQSTKNKIMSSLQRQQAMMQAQPSAGKPKPKGEPL